MHAPPRILVVDDMTDNLDVVRLRLERHGFEIVTAADGAEGLEKARECLPDLVLLDIMMPKMDGIEALKRLKADVSLPFTPVILLTAKTDAKDVVAGLDAGADDFLSKPFDHTALVARVRAMLRIKSLHDTVQQQAADLADLNRTLEERVRMQVEEIERIGRLKRFLAPQIAEAIIDAGDEGAALLENHRREIVVLVCDMRGFTAFSETAEPEEVMKVLRDYHATLCPLVHRFEGTLDRFTGDGMIVFFNDPLPCPDAAARAVRLGIAMRDGVGALAAGWRKLGYDIGFGVGIAQGYATIGRIGFDGRFDYSAIGTVSNVADRLCGEAKDGQILVTQRVASESAAIGTTEFVGEMTLKGLSRPVVVHNVLSAPRSKRGPAAF